MPPDPEEFLTGLAAALTERGWIAEPVPDSETDLGAAGTGPRFAEYTSCEADLRVRTRRRPGDTSIELAGLDWKADLGAAGSLEAALAAIDAAETDQEQDGYDERTVPERLFAAGWTWSVDNRCRHGVERTWYSPDGTRRIRNDLSYPWHPSWFLTHSPAFADGKRPTGDQATPPAVIAALALSA